MNPQNIKDSIQAVIDGLTPLAQKMQIPIEQLWSWAIKHNYAIAITEVSFFVLMLIALIPYTALLKHGLKQKDGSSYSNFDNSDGLTGLAFAISIVLFTALISATIGLFTDAIPRLISPEWHTIQDISHLIKGE